uniref:Acyltransferase 3 domain-containing protein n=1 Tax=Eubacterium plexicaudatum ASF492 TaxID=1235802 RepID=N2AID1_9FIRM
MKRFFRIWPTYVAGFSITFLMIWIYTRSNGSNFPYEVKDYIFQISLLRDWFWKPSLDGISWTLETEIKFYIVICILFYLKKARSKHMISVASIMMLLFNFITYFFMEYLLLKHIRIYCFFYTIQFMNINILFMLLGVCIYNYYKQYWSLEYLVEMLLKIYLLLLFAVIFSVQRSNLHIYTSSYLFAFITFLIAFIFKDRVKNIKILNYFAEISYPFYIVHGLNGYIIETFLIQHNVSPYISFLAALLWAVVIACILHITIEKFSLKLFAEKERRKGRI